jgi:thiol-disulfide isomerase/thioredoxin
VIHRFRFSALVAGVLVAAAALPATAGAQAAPADSVFKGFHRVGEWLLFVDGGQDAAAEIYRLENPQSFLVISSRLASPALISGQGRSVETVGASSLLRQADGSIDLRADAVLTPSGSFQLSANNELIFNVGGKRAEMRDREPLLGAQTADKLVAYSPEYGRLAKAYQPSGPVLDRVKAAGEPVLVTVYFGSWCPHCKQMVPRMMRVAEGLTGSKVKIEYYGLPRDIISDAKAKALGINGVPTAVITAGGKEIGRIDGQSFKIPELAINNALLSAGIATAGR